MHPHLFLFNFLLTINKTLEILWKNRRLPSSLWLGLRFYLPRFRLDFSILLNLKVIGRLAASLGLVRGWVDLFFGGCLLAIEVDWFYWFLFLFFLHFAVTAHTFGFVLLSLLWKFCQIQSQPIFLLFRFWSRLDIPCPFLLAILMPNSISDPLLFLTLRVGAAFLTGIVNLSRFGIFITINTPVFCNFGWPEIELILSGLILHHNFFVLELLRGVRGVEAWFTVPS